MSERLFESDKKPPLRLLLIRNGMPMKSYIVFSDIHGNRAAFDKLLPLINENDGAIFAGDGANTFERFEIEKEFYGVSGNNDYCDLPWTCVIQIEKRRVLLTHGHLFGARGGHRRLIEEAKKENCDTVIFGHTHRAEICEEEGVTIINPGTCMKYCPSKTFVYLVINGKKITAVINDYALQNA